MHPATESGKYWNLGKLDIMSYAPVERKMVLVKTSANDNTDAAAVQTELNRIYNPAGISWSVSSEQFIYNTDNIFEGKSGIISTYLPNMRALNAAFMAAKNDKLETKTAYLFLVNQTAGGDRDKQGFMPRGMQFGYINTASFSSPSGGGREGAAVIAHELGHGAFKLYHTFNSGYGSTAAATQGKTENLMDYKGGTNLAKWQWDQMYDPAILNGVFDGDKEGEYFGNTEWIKELVEEIRVARYKKQQYLDITKWKKYLDGGGINNKSVIFYDKVNYGAINVKRLHAGVDKINVQNISISDAVVTVGDKATVANQIADYVQFTVRDKNLNESGDLAKKLKTYLEASNFEEEIKHNRILLFVNGYRLSLPENKNTTNQIAKGDMFDYWESIDQSFIGRITPDPKNIYYADGHMSLTTSNHNVNNDVTSSIVNFYCSANNLIDPFSTSAKEQALKDVKYLQSPAGLITTIAGCHGIGLNTKANINGFNTRKAEGSKAGENLLNSMKTNPRIYFDKDGKSPNTLYIVCHSMGYAYALGMIEVLRGKLPFGSLYILAAENAVSGKVNINEWQEVWQYGSDLGRNDGKQPDADNKQDGVAPQTKAAGLLETQRVYIPYGQPKGFLQSHSVGNYGWIFTQSKHTPNDNGYVTPR